LLAGGTGADRRDAARDLADVLKFLRADAKEVLNSDDERDLLKLANNFGIRYHCTGIAFGDLTSQHRRVQVFAFWIFMCSTRPVGLVGARRPVPSDEDVLMDPRLRGLGCGWE
jgi:hypothetical protein